MTPGLSDWAGRTALVTGYGGFLGSALARTLARRGARVIGTVRSEPARPPDGAVEVLHADMPDISTVKALFAGRTIDIVFHLAAQTLPTLAREEPCQTFDVNVRGTWNLLETARLATRRPRIVLVSTDSVYGDNDGEPFTEDAGLGSVFPYEASKSCAEMVARCYHQTYGLDIATARFCNIYGPGDVAESRLMAGVINAALADRGPTLRGDGSAVRNYLYVDDAVEALLAMDRPGNDGGVFNFCDEQSYSVLDIVTHVLALAGRPDLAPTLGTGTPGEISIKRSSAGKAWQVLGWRAKTSLDDGLRATIEWHRARLMVTEKAA